MILNNKFYIEQLKSVVFLGQSDFFKKLIIINKKYNLNTHIITSSHQSKLLKKDKILNYKIFDKLDLEFENFIKKNTTVKNTIFISLGARYIFKKQNINFFQNNLVNFHCTRLPFDAGGGDYSWKILREDRIDNQLVHLVDEGLDSGPILFNKLSLFPSKCKIPIDFKNHSEKIFLGFYESFLKSVLNNISFDLIYQQKYLSRYNPRLNTERDGFIDWNLNSYDLINFINAFDDPFKGASTYLNNGNHGRLFIKKAQLHGGDSSNHPFMSGIVSRHDGSWLVVSTKSKHMLIIEQVFNSKNENIIHKIKVGDRFYTNTGDLENSKNKRVFYNSKGLK